MWGTGSRQMRSRAVQHSDCVRFSSEEDEEEEEEEEEVVERGGGLMGAVAEA